MKVLDVEIPRPFVKRQKESPPVVGVDTESMTNGYAFLVADSSGRHVWIHSLDDVVKFFDYEDYAYCILVAFNLNFDASVMLKWAGKKICTDLVNNGHVNVGSCVIEYIPSKYLRFRFGNRFVRVFDVAQFFRGSLDYNAKQYLGMSKIPMHRKSFTEEDYGDTDILTYCAKDAFLTQGLGEYVVQAFGKLGVKVQSLASPASVLESYVLDQLLLRNPTKGVPKGAMEFAVRCFSGAWFENFKAGYFEHTYRYDMVSAYPSVIRGLVDLSLGVWEHTKVRPEHFVYGYVFARVFIPKMHISPVVFKSANGGIFHPHGIWWTYLTAKEIDWIVTHGGWAEIKDAWWFVPSTEVMEFSGVVDKFFKVKRDASADSMEQWTAKVALAGMYGKFLQHRGGRGGRLYNPVYAAEITSAVRLKVADACMLSPSKIIAVMSDCVVSDGPLSLVDGSGLGDWSKTGPSASLWIGPVQYEAEGQDRRFRHIPWKVLLEGDPNALEYTVTRNAPLTLRQAILLNNFDGVGVFADRSITFNVRKLNWKRFWPERPSCGGDLLTRQYDSVQLHVGSRLKEEDMRLWEI